MHLDLFLSSGQDLADVIAALLQAVSCSGVFRPKLPLFIQVHPRNRTGLVAELHLDSDGHCL